MLVIREELDIYQHCASPLSGGGFFVSELLLASDTDFKLWMLSPVDCVKMKSY